MSDEPVRITDRRAAARAASTGIVVARGSSDVRRALALGRTGSVSADPGESRRMAASRLANQKVAYASGGSMSFATQRPRDMLFYNQQNNMPFDFNREDHLAAARLLCRMVYRSHSLMASVIDIYSQWPLTGMEFTCKDPQLVDFYSTLFLDQLDYEEYLPDMGREYWSVGEAWPLGAFNEDLGVWEADELINPDDVFVEKSAFVREPRFYIRLPESLRQVLRTGQPAHEYAALMRSYPELVNFSSDNARMPVSNVLLKQMKFKADTFNPRGIPIMARAFRPLMQEEMLNAAQDAIADRLYTPLIIARIGASASDLGTQQPWVPTQEQLADFEGSMDAALAADFRLLTTHFAVQVDSVFGRETMPNFDADFERLAEKQLQAFGMSKTMISGAGGGETYAADALNRDLVSQLLSRYQRYMKRFVRDRALVVAEAQEHYDYDSRGGKRYPIMEEVLVVDEETGQKKIIEQPKLLVPDLSLKAMNMRDEENQQQLFEALRASGVPISMKTRLTNVPIDLNDEVEATREEQVELAVEAQKTRKATFQRLRAENLPVPEDLMQDFGPKALDAKDSEVGADPLRTPQLGVDDVGHAALAPTPEDLMQPPGTPLEPETDTPASAQVIPLPTNRAMPTDVPGRTRPPESDEQRANMPRPAVKVSTTVRAVDGETGEVVDKKMEFEGGLIAGPRHVGSRRYASVSRDVPLADEPDDDSAASG